MQPRLLVAVVVLAVASSSLLACGGSDSSGDGSSVAGQAGGGSPSEGGQAGASGGTDTGGTAGNTGSGGAAGASGSAGSGGGDSCATWYRDADGDGFGHAGDSLVSCEEPVGYVSNADDCNDAEAAVNPDAEEVCDTVDNDCDDVVDADAIDRTNFYPDIDGDGFGDASATAVLACTAPEGHVSNADDCNDAEAAVNPDAEEVCDTVDNDCDDVVDADAIDRTNFYPDGDGDGFGDASAMPKLLCVAPANHLTDSSDCNDNDSTVHPDALETCDGIDQDCDGTADDGAKVTVANQNFDTIQAGIDAASDGETVYICAGTYAENLAISKSLSLLGVAGRSTTIVASAAADTSVIKLSNASDLVIEGLTVQGATKTVGDGGGIHAVGGGTLEVVSSALTKNKAARGGGLFVENTSVLLVDTVIDQNVATSSGGGIGLVGGATSTATQLVELQGVTVMANTAQDGGGIHASGAAVITMDADTTLAGNSATQGGCLMVVGTSTAAPMVDGASAVCEANKATNLGGGAYVDGPCKLRNLQIIGNTASNGGGIYLRYTGGYLENLVIMDNIASLEGGGIYFTAASGGGQADSAVADKVSLIGNQATGGGGVSLDGKTVLTIMSAIVYVNEATGTAAGGGALLQGQSTLLATNSDFGVAVETDNLPDDVYAKNSYGDIGTVTTMTCSVQSGCTIVQ